MNSRRRDAAFTLLECVVLFATVAMLFLTYLMLKPGDCRGVRNRCTANLKNLALGFNLWAQDHQNRFPMEVPIAEGGTREFALAGDLLPNLVVASNELRTAEILVCPDDKKRKPAKSFSTLTTNNVSYFLNAEAALTNENQIIAGDRNLMVAGSNVKPGLVEITKVSLVGWGKELHNYGGNVALAEGSAHQVTTKGLQDLLRLRATNGLIVP